MRWLRTLPVLSVLRDEKNRSSILPAGDPQFPALRASTAHHRQAGLASVAREHYEGGLWLGSFAVYLTTRRGLKQ